jgi:ABC-type bacteriocin/lantibiotic exporter with double-glycine peptidase domain
VKFPFNLDETINGLTKVTLRGGVVGKVTFTLCLVCIVMLGMVYTFHNIWLTSITLAMMFCMVMVMLWRVINFADRHPEAALLEGAEFIVHQRMLHEAKSIKTIKADEIEKIEAEEGNRVTVSQEAALIPDQSSEHTDAENGSY